MNRTPDDLLQSLKVILFAEQDQIYKYFSSTRNALNYSCLDILMTVILSHDAQTIFDSVEQYKVDKQEREEQQRYSQVKDLADRIGIDKLCEFAEQLKGERDERAARKMD